VIGEFNRIGYFKFSRFVPRGGVPDQNLYDPFMEAFRLIGGSVASSIAAEVLENPEFPDQRYIISIV
jgi:hypothetical protein